MMLIYSQEEGELSADEDARIRAAHQSVLRDATSEGILLGAAPLAATASATTIRMQNGQMLITDGPFAETKEQLAGYYILDCKDLDEAIEWAAKIPSGCAGREGCVEIRPMPGMAVHNAGKTYA
jgi:hypothetical protein